MTLLKVFFTNNRAVVVLAQLHRQTMLLRCALARLVLGQKSSSGTML